MQYIYNVNIFLLLIGVYIMEKKKTRHEQRTNFTIRVEEDLKQRFIAVCKANETDASKEMRKFIKDYLAKHSQTKMEF